MATRRMKNTTILAKIGVTYGTDTVPSGAANSILVSDVSFTPLEASNVDRNNVRAYMGASENLVGTASKSLSFAVEMVGSGTAGVAPSWGLLLRACGFAETLTAVTRVDYIPISTSFEWVDIYVYFDGVLHKMLGCRGTATLDFSAGAVPKIKFSFKGIDAGIAASAPAGVDYTSWQTPQVVTDTNTADLVLGCTHTLVVAPALTAGTAYPYSKLSLDLGIDAPFIPLIGQESVEIMDRKVTGDLEMDLTAAQDVTFMGNVKANTLTSIGLVHGTVVTKKTLIFAPAAQLTTPSYGDLSGKLMNNYKLVLPPTGTGNNELRIVTSF
jgi:hypothetical protein